MDLDIQSSLAGLPGTLADRLCSQFIFGINNQGLHCPKLRKITTYVALQSLIICKQYLDRDTINHKVCKGLA